MRRDYELGFILNPEVSEEQTSAILTRIEQIVTSQEGEIVRVNQWGRRRLAYPIERQREGFYVFIDMILSPETVLELERTLKVSEEVLRHMMKRRDPKAIQKEREDAVAAEAARAEAAAKAEADAAQAAQNAQAAPPAEETASAETTPEQPAPVNESTEAVPAEAPTPATPESEPATATDQSSAEETVEA